jgi:Uncharacterized alpha/beta hydrolase domain (DUF2235)
VWFVPQKSSKKYAFVDTNVESNIEYAFQALALDEHRGPFTPTIWAAPKNPPKELKQCWFRGVHCDIGGGSYPDQEIANLSLAWMMSQLESNGLITFNHDAFWKLIELSARGQTKQIPGQPEMPKLKSWGLGRIHDSMKWYYSLLTKARIREPRSFTKGQLFPPWWKQLFRFFSSKPGEPLENTQEFIHSSVGRRAIAENTPCAALANWTYDEPAKAWRKAGAEPLLEDKLRGLELELAERWESIVDQANKHAAS